MDINNAKKIDVFSIGKLMQFALKNLFPEEFENLKNEPKDSVWGKTKTLIDEAI